MKSGDSKTAKRIEVVPCPNKSCCKGGYNVSVDGDLVMVEGFPWCGTEAEAQAKKMELEASHISVDVYRRDEPAVAQPTETRPPRLFCTRCGYQIGGTICTKCGQVPRAAAPVERCIQCQAKIGSRHTDQCPQPGYVDETQVEVEPAPRPQPNETEKAFAGFLNQRAASSPVARPQTVETYDCDCDDLLCRDNRSCTSAAAARVEQPTPRDAICPGCESPRSKHKEGRFCPNPCRACNEGVQHKHSKSCPAAPVVEQRELSAMEIREHICDAITGLSFIQDAIFQKNYGTAKEYAETHEKKLQELADEVLAASQRTEGEGQPK